MWLERRGYWEKAWLRAVNHKVDFIWRRGSCKSAGILSEQLPQASLVVIPIDKINADRELFLCRLSNRCDTRHVREFSIYDEIKFFFISRRDCKKVKRNTKAGRFLKNTRKSWVLKKAKYTRFKISHREVLFTRNMILRS